MSRSTTRDAVELTARKDGRATLIEDTELLRWVKSLPRIGRQLM
jgi:hypothetical protein